MDYNIYIHTVGQGGNESPTTPWQLKENKASVNETINSDSFSPSTAVSSGAAFLTNPDSIIGGALRTSAGKMGLVATIIAVVAKITDSAITSYQNLAAPMSGNYEDQIRYNNFKATLRSFTNPIGTEVQRLHMVLDRKRENLKSEQERLLLGDSMINSQYGRYL